MLWTILPTARINSHGRAPHIWSLSFIQSTLTISKLLKYHTCRAFTPVASHSEKRVIWNTSILITWGTVTPKPMLWPRPDGGRDSLHSWIVLDSYHKPQSKRCSLLATLQSTDYNVAECSFHWYDFLFNKNLRLCNGKPTSHEIERGNSL